MGYEQRVITSSTTLASTASTTTPGSTARVAVRYQAMLVIVNVTAFTGGTLDVYLQDSFDDGTTWYDCAHFSQLAATASLKQAFSVALDKTPVSIGIGTTGTPGVALAANSVRPGPWGPLIRPIYVTGAGTSGANIVETVTFIPTEYEH